MKKLLMKIFFISIYLCTSSTLLHVWVMAHSVDDSSADSIHHDVWTPCHERANKDIQKSLPQTNCFESCMWVYDTLWWFVTININEFDSCVLNNWIFVVHSKTYDTKKYLFTKNDPPPLTLMWYARVGKEIRKME